MDKNALIWIFGLGRVVPTKVSLSRNLLQVYQRKNSPRGGVSGFTPRIVSGGDPERVYSLDACKHEPPPSPKHRSSLLSPSIPVRGRPPWCSPSNPPLPVRRAKRDAAGPRLKLQFWNLHLRTTLHSWVGAASGTGSSGRRSRRPKIGFSLRSKPVFWAGLRRPDERLPEKSRGCGAKTLK